MAGRMACLTGICGRDQARTSRSQHAAPGDEWSVGGFHEHGNELHGRQAASRSRDPWRRPCVSGDAVRRKVAKHRHGAAGRPMWLGRLRSREEALMDRQPHIATRVWSTTLESYHAGRARHSVRPKGDNPVLKPRLEMRRRYPGACLGTWCQRTWSALNRPYEIGATSAKHGSPA